MALDKLVDSAQLDADLEDIADAIRAKGGTSAQLAFPDGFVDAIDAIRTGGGMPVEWAGSVQEVTVGPNSVSNMADVQTYFSGYNCKFIMLESALTANNQFVFGYSQNSNGTMTNAYRWRGGAILGTNVASNYDGALVEGTKYYLFFE